GPHRRSRTNLLKITVDHALALRDAFSDGYEAVMADTRGNESLVRLVSFSDDVDVFAKLTGSQGRLWHHQRIRLRPDGQPNANVLAGKQAAVGITDSRPRNDSAGRAIDRIVDEGQLSAVARLRLTRQKNVGHDFPGGARLPDHGKIGLARIECDVDRIELHQSVQRRADCADQRADRSLVAAEPSRKWCANLGIAEIELGRSDSRLVHRQSRFSLPCRAGALIKSVLGEEAALGERGPAIEV